jgi:antitoxin PrlF
MKAIVAERGQVTIPKKIRDRLGIVPQTVLEFHEDNGKLIAVKASEEDPVAKVLGCLPSKKTTDTIMTELRDSK